MDTERCRLRQGQREGVQLFRLWGVAQWATN